MEWELSGQHRVIAVELLPCLFQKQGEGGEETAGISGEQSLLRLGEAGAHRHPGEGMGSLLRRGGQGRKAVGRGCCHFLPDQALQPAAQEGLFPGRCQAIPAITLLASLCLLHTRGPKLPSLRATRPPLLFPRTAPFEQRSPNAHALKNLGLCLI